MKTATTGASSADATGATGDTQAEATAGETGEPASCAERPAYPELYSSCAGAGSCGASGLICASQTGADPVENQAFCTKTCFTDADCPSVGDCSATAVCVNGGSGQGACALDCADGRQCPDDMMCLSDLDPAMPRDLCF